LEMRREKLRALAPLEGPPPAPSDLRVRQLRARDLLRGDLEGPDLEEHVAESVLTTRLDRVLNWGRANSVFPLTFVFSFCSINMLSIRCPRYNRTRLGAEKLRSWPGQSDMSVQSGRTHMQT